MSAAKHIIGIIPARYGSTRLPGKPLALLNGKPLVQWVYETARKVLPRVIVATDDRRILNAVQRFGGEAILTPKSLKSGMDRVAKVASKVYAEIVVNIQGDEPLLSARTILRTVALLKDPRVHVGTAACPMTSEKEYRDPHVVKVVRDKRGTALYFSRSGLPFFRKPPRKTTFLKHIGLYVYRRDFLLKLAEWPQTYLEKTEGLEQLRVLENGYNIKVATTPDPSIGVDTPGDLALVRKILARRLKTND